MAKKTKYKSPLEKYFGTREEMEKTFDNIKKNGGLKIEFTKKDIDQAKTSEKQIRDREKVSHRTMKTRFGPSNGEKRFHL